MILICVKVTAYSMPRFAKERIVQYDSYSGAVDAAMIERRLRQCQSADHENPQALERCAREAVRSSCCPCIVSEEIICNALCNSVSETMMRGGLGL